MTSETTTITVTNTADFYKGLRLTIGDDPTQYVIIDSTATTLTIRKANIIDRLKDWLYITYRTLEARFLDWWYRNEPEPEYDEELD